MPRRLLTRIATSLAMLVATALAPAAQSFAPVAQVNEDVVTAWELQQRQRMLAVLNAPPEAQAEALQSLINERLQLQAAESVGVTVSESDIEAGLEDFAARGNLNAEQFLTLIGRAGVDETTIRGFIRAGLAWRDAVRARFGDTIQISDDDIERARETVSPETGPRVLLSEIVLPARNETEQVESRALAEELGRIGSVDAFAAAAREYSTADSAEQGGRVEWIQLADLAGPVAAAVANLRPGQVSAPVPVSVQDEIAVFQLRARDENPAASGDVPIDYAQYLIPGGRTESTLAEAAWIDARVDTCNDLYGVAQGQSPERLVRETRPAGQIPADIAAELARLDRGEVSTALTRGGALVFLMLCERGAGGELAIGETAIGARLRNEELTGRAGLWLAELRSEAFIRIGE